MPVSFVRSRHTAATTTPCRRGLRARNAVTVGFGLTIAIQVGVDTPCPTRPSMRRVDHHGRARPITASAENSVRRSHLQVLGEERSSLKRSLKQCCAVAQSS